MGQGSGNTSANLTQRSYKPTQYSDESFPVVGEPPAPLEFVPMNVAVIDASTDADAMFADYGGVDKEKRQTRWHLPQNIAWKSESEKAEERKRTSEPTVTITQRELDRLKEEAREAGKLEGIEMAVEENSVKLLAFEEKTRTLLTDLRTQIIEHRAMTEQKAVDLAFQISKLIIDHAVEINPEYIVSVIHDALEKVGSATIHRVRVSAQDLEFIDVLGVRGAMKQFDGTWEFVADQGVKAGCVVECTSGEVDFRLDEAWERVRESVVKVTR